MKKIKNERQIHNPITSGKDFFKVVCMLAFIILTCFLILLSASLFSNSQNRQGKIYSLSDSPVSRRQAGEIFSAEQDEEAPISYVLWRQLENQQIENPELNKNANFMVIELAGNDWKSVLGESMRLEESDYAGCIISADIAFSLFGSQDVTGKKVKWDKHSFEIRGILRKQTGVLAIHAADINSVSSENNHSDFTILRAEDGFHMLGFSKDISNEELSLFKNRHGINPIDLNLTFFSAINYLSMNFLAFFILLSSTFLFVRKANKEKSRPVFRMILILGAIFVLIGLWILLRLGFQPDSRFFPTEIADFSFWGNLFNSLGKELSRLFSHFSDIPVRNMFLETGKCFLSGITACVLGISIQRLVRIDSESKWFACAIVSLLAAFIAAAAANAAGVRFPYMTAQFLLFPLLFLRKYLMQQFGLIEKDDLQGEWIAAEAGIQRIG